MAKKIVETLIDDVTGAEGEDVQEFSVPLPVYDDNGTLTTLTYRFDASPETQTRVREAVRKAEEKYVRDLAKSLKFVTDKVQPVKSRNGSSNSTPADRARSQAIREWAKKSGMTVAERGRIPNDVVEAYDKRDESATDEAA